MSNSKTAKERLCPEFDDYMEDMEEDMQDLVMVPTEKRLKIIIMVTKDPLEKLLVLLNLTDDAFTSYQIPKRVYDNFQGHVYSVLKKKCEKGVNFGRVKQKMDKTKIWGLFKGYWFHNAPKEMTSNLWIPLLKDIAKYYNHIGKVYGNENALNWTEYEIQEYLKKMFLKNLFEAKCQINAQSNPSGPVIQFAAWKISTMQQLINRYFDRSYSSKWRIWLNSTQSGKKMRINSVIQHLIKPYAVKQFKECCILCDIEPDLMEFNVNGENVENMELIQYLRDDNDDEKSQSDQTYNSYQSSPSQHSIALSVNNSISTGESTESMGVEAVSTANNNNNYNDELQYEPSVISAPYIGNHGGLRSTHSNYRHHPYSACSVTKFDQFGGRSYNVHKKRNVASLRHQKCGSCFKCLHHCKCGDNGTISIPSNGLFEIPMMDQSSGMILQSIPKTNYAQPPKPPKPHQPFMPFVHGQHIDRNNNNNNNNHTLSSLNDININGIGQNYYQYPYQHQHQYQYQYQYQYPYNYPSNNNNNNNNIVFNNNFGVAPSMDLQSMNMNNNNNNNMNNDNNGNIEDVNDMNMDMDQFQDDDFFNAAPNDIAPNELFLSDISNLIGNQEENNDILQNSNSL